MGKEFQFDNAFLWRDKDSVKEDAVDSVNDEAFTDAPVEIYNTMGQRLNSMSAPGLYIVRQGNKVKKVLVK